MDDRKPSAKAGSPDPQGATRRVQQFLASFKRRTLPASEGQAGAAAMGDKRGAQAGPLLK